MNRSVAWRVVLLAALMLSCATAARADYGAGRTAWEAGRYAEAQKQWGAAARKGDRRAMLALGRAFVKGLGVPQDFVEAHKWFNLAAARGDAKAAAERDALAAKMTPQQVASAQVLARAWRSAGRPGTTAVRPRSALLPRRKAGRRPTRRAPRPGVGGVAARKNAALRAAAAGDISALEKALAAGADPNARGRRGWTPLMYAANKGYTLLVPPLLKAGAKPNLRAADGATALFIAALHGHSEIIEALMKAGADPSIKGPKGRTAMYVALKRYGSIKAAREKGESPALLALLEGKTWAQVKVKADDAAYARAHSVRTAPAYAGYLSSYPQGRHAEEAKRLKAQLEAEAKRLKAQLEKLKHMGWPAGKVFRECPDCPEMVIALPGSFLMGSPSGEEKRDSDEGPRHRVTIEKPFAVGKYEVTFAEWDACVANGGCGGHRPGDKGWGRGRRPVIYVSWEDAKAYVQWLSRKTGKQYRLLSEAEWEYAARAGTTSPFHFGSTISTSQASYNGNYTYGAGSKGLYRKKTVPVGSFPENGFGLHDAHGNVWEWVEDCWNGNYSGAPTDASAWMSGDCGKRVLRGGSWIDGPWNLRSAFRSRLGTGFRSYVFGFRVARTLTP